MCKFRSSYGFNNMSIYIDYVLGETKVKDVFNEYLKIYDPMSDDFNNPYTFHVYYDGKELDFEDFLPDPDDQKLIVEWS